MPFCPVCRAEYRPGFESCADCDVALVDQLSEPIGHPAPRHEADVAVIRAPSRPLAEMWAELLGQNGIACRLVPLTSSGSIYAPADEPFEVRVPAISAARAHDPPPARSRVIGAILRALAARCSAAAGYL